MRVKGPLTSTPNYWAGPPGPAPRCPPSGRVGRAGIVHLPRTALQTARCTATARTPLHRLAQRSRTNRRRRDSQSALHLPPTSVARTHKRWAPPRLSSRLAVAGLFAPPSCRQGDAIALRRPANRAAVSPQGRNQGGVAAQSLAPWGRAVDDEVKPSAVVRCNPRRRGVGEPLLGDDASLGADGFPCYLDPRPLEYEASASKQAGARAGREVVAQLVRSGPASVHSFSTAGGTRDWEREAKPAP